MVWWVSPELPIPDQFSCEVDRPTEVSDRCGLGMVTYSGQTRFAESGVSLLLGKSTVCTERPQNEELVWFAYILWEAVELCWTLDQTTG